MKTNLTKRAIDAIPLPETGQALYYDTTLQGFGLRATKTAKTFFAEGYLGAKQKRVKIGRYGVFTPDQAREEARQILAKLARGEDPSAKSGAGVSLAVAYEDYKALRTGGQGKQLKAKTLAGYDWLIDVVLEDYKPKKLSSFTEADVRSIHAKLTKNRGPVVANNAMRLLRMLINHARWAYPDLNSLANPVECLSRLHLWNPDKRRKGFIRSDDLPDWIARAEVLDGVPRGAILMMLFMGLRREECLTLKKSDIGDACLVVRNTKNGIQHTAPIGPYLWGRISPLLALAALGEAVSPHDLRRAFVTHLNGLDPAPSIYTIKRLMNHYADWDDVTAGYIQHEEKKLREVVERLERSMLGLNLEEIA